MTQLPAHSSQFGVVSYFAPSQTVTTRSNDGWWDKLSFYRYAYSLDKFKRSLPGRIRVSFLNSRRKMSNVSQPTTGADAVDAAIAQGLDLDGSPIPPNKLELYKQVMAKEEGRQRSGVQNTMRSRIVRIGAKHFSQADLNQMLLDAEFTPLKDKEIAFYYGGK